MNEVVRQVVSAEYGLLAAVAGAATAAVVGWLLRQLLLHLHDARARAYAGRLVAWAQQAIPDKSERYVQVAALLSRRFPGLSAHDAEVLIESEVHALKCGLMASSLQQPAAGSQPSAKS